MHLATGSRVIDGPASPCDRVDLGVQSEEIALKDTLETEEALVVFCDITGFLATTLPASEFISHVKPA